MSFSITEYFSELLSKEVGDLRDSQFRDPDKEEGTIFIGGDNVKVCKQQSDSPEFLLLSSKDVEARLILKEIEKFQVNQ